MEYVIVSATIAIGFFFIAVTVAIDMLQSCQCAKCQPTNNEV